MGKFKTLKLDSPYFSAWKRYNWPPGTWGLGISVRFLVSAIDSGEDIVVEYETKELKYTWFCKTHDLEDFAVKHYPEFIAGKTRLLVFPVTLFLEAPKAPSEVHVTGVAIDIHHKVVERTNHKFCVIALSDEGSPHDCVVTPRLYDQFFMAHTLKLGVRYCFVAKKATSQNNKPCFEVMSLLRLDTEGGCPIVYKL